VNLASKAVILILAGEVNVFKSLEHDLDALSRLSEHRFQWRSHSHVTSLSQLLGIGANFEESIDDCTVVREFASSFLDCELCVGTHLGEGFFTDDLLRVKLLLFDANLVWGSVADSSCQRRYDSLLGCTRLQILLQPAHNVLGFVFVAVL